MSNLLARRGDTNVYDFTVTRDGSPVDLSNSGTKIWFTAKRNRSDADAQAIIRLGTTNTGFSGVATLAGGTTGRFRVTVPTSGTDTLETGTVFLYWDAQLRENDGRLTTVDAGRLAVSSDVTRTAS